MIKIELARMVEEDIELRRKPLTYGEIHETTGIHRKILSRILNSAHRNTSSEHIGKLIEFFFLRWRSTRNTPTQDKLLLSEIVSKLVTVFPEDNKFWTGLGTLKDTKDRYKLDTDVLWSMRTDKWLDSIR